MPKLSPWLLFAALGCISVGNACSSDSDTTTEATYYTIDIARLDDTSLLDDDGKPLDAVEVALRCDGTLAVATVLPPATDFVLRPANACGQSLRCGYVRVEGLSQNGSVLASVDTATPEGVLRFASAQLPELAQIRVALIRGLDQEPLLNPDKTEVETTRSPAFVAPTDCAETGSGGAGGSGGAAGAGGQAPELGGAGGASAGAGGASAGAGGAGGDTGGQAGAAGGLGGAAGASATSGGAGAGN